MTYWEFFPLARGPYRDGQGVVAGWAITSYFGGRQDPFTGRASHHGGQDLAYSGCTGAAIVAPNNGTMAQAWDSSGGGNWTGITLDDGSYIGIGHAIRFADGAHYRRVHAGEIVAFVGSTGASSGPHAHIAYRKPGQNFYSDPYDLLLESSGNCINDFGETPRPPVDEPDTKPGGTSLMWTYWYQGAAFCLFDVPVDAGHPDGQAWRWIPSPQKLNELVFTGKRNKDVNITVLDDPKTDWEKAFQDIFNAYPIDTAPPSHPEWIRPPYVP